MIDTVLDVLDDPRRRSWLQAMLALLFPAAAYLFLIVSDPTIGDGEHGMVPLVLLVVSFLASVGLSFLALLSSLSGYRALDRPKPVLRLVEAALLGLPFISLVLFIVFVLIWQALI